MKNFAVVMAAFLFAFNAYAANGSNKTVNAENIYFGAGLGLNSLSGIDLSDGLGYQIFAGYVLPVNAGDGSLAVEVGYMDSGDLDVGVSVPGFPGFTGFSAKARAKGVWSTAVYEFPLKNNISLLGRAGLDFGDDDGLIIGGGVGFAVNAKIDIRIEYVIRDNIDSLQGNIVFRL